MMSKDRLGVLDDVQPVYSIVHASQGHAEGSPVAPALTYAAAFSVEWLFVD
jgi:hypothetical protein